MLDLRPKLLARFATAALAVGLLTGPALAQPRGTAAAHAATQAPAASDKDIAAEQQELIRLLRLSPTLTTVVEHDPSLLANQEYVRKNNPQLAQYLESHPEIALNPEFYLFSHLKQNDDGPDRALDRAVWPEYSQPRREPSAFQGLAGSLPPMIAFLCFLAAFLWLFRQFMENRRWGRIFKLQTEVHNKLIDKIGASQELLTYMQTEAGKRFLEAAPLPVNFEREERMPGMVARVLTPLQIGIVLTLLGIGLMLLRHARPEMNVPMLVLGTVVLMPGIGFILSAGVTWFLAGRLGLMPSGTPDSADAAKRPYSSPRVDARDGQ
jgi:hypothetical protein